MDNILKKFIEIAPNSGFTNDTLIEACILCNDSAAICRFPDGIYSILYEIEQEVNLITRRNYNENLTVMGISGRIKLALLSRLKAYKEFQNFREFIKSKLQFFFSIKNFPKGVIHLYGVVDFIWRLIQDSSTDFNFYTKRLTLAIVWKCVLSKFADDYSDAFIETDIYIDKQLEKFKNFAKTKSRLKNLFGIK